MGVMECWEIVVCGETKNQELLDASLHYATPPRSLVHQPRVCCITATKQANM